MRGWRFTQRAIERVAENRIRQAMAEGAFDGLPGEGKPIAGIDEPYDPLWWVKSWIRRERIREVARVARQLRRPRP